MVLVTGVIDTTSNYVEHEEVVADHIERVACSVSDARRVIAGTDCGFDTSAGLGDVAPSVVWEKLRSMRRGADLANRTNCSSPRQVLRLNLVQRTPGNCSRGSYRRVGDRTCGALRAEPIHPTRRRRPPRSRSSKPRCRPESRPAGRRARWWRRTASQSHCCSQKR